MSDFVVELRNISKKFGHFYANEGINFTLKKGEVHALLGENGAGKSTLMNMLYGLIRPTNGEIFIHGKRELISSPSKAIKLKIGMVHQHFMLIGPLSVSENIVLGKEPRKFLFKFDIKKANAEVLNLTKKFGLDIDPTALIENLSVGMQQRVEILKTLYRGADIIILDEPTAVLTPQEIVELGKIIKNLTLQNKSVIIITHKLKEIKNFADRCTIIRKGKYISTVDVSSVSEEDLASLMVGRKVDLKVSSNKGSSEELLLKVRNLNVKNDRKILSVKNLDLDIKKGEILGLAGVDGNGQHELVEAIIGVRKVESGEIYYDNEDIKNLSPKEIAQKKVACIPEDRHKDGLVLDFSIALNSILKKFKDSPFSKWGILNFSKISEFSKNLIERFDVRPPEEEKLARELSGGNQQKVIIARELAQNPNLLIACQSTRGLDVGAIEYVHQALIEQKKRGCSILLFSLELDEILNLSDRIAVISDGKIVKVFEHHDADEKQIGLYMGGGHE